MTTPEHLVNGVLPAQELRHAIAAGWIRSDLGSISPENVQPASVDLTLGDEAYRLRCSFLPDSGSTVREKLQDLKLDTVDLRGGAVLEVNRPYLIPLRERLDLPRDLRGKANPKSSTGRVDVFTRVITDRNYRFDEIQSGYQGELFLEVVSGTFTIKLQPGLSLNQLRLARGTNQCSDDDIREAHETEPLAYTGGKSVPHGNLPLATGLLLSVDLLPRALDRLVAYRAKTNSRLLDLSLVGQYNPQQFWEAVEPEGPKGRVILDPGAFYLLLSHESVRIPPQYAAEMTAYDPTAGELRTHYAGFFDPGFGFGPQRKGSRAVLEVRAHDVPFMIEHGQPIAKLGYERMAATPDVLYGSDIGSSYQDQELTLSKHFRRFGALAPVQMAFGRVADVGQLTKAAGSASV